MQGALASRGVNPRFGALEVVLTKITASPRVTHFNLDMTMDVIVPALAGIPNQDATHRSRSR